MRINEILVLHHSHLDIGYTHSQPILWELQRDYIDQALDLLDATADWPAISQPRWTCEVTMPVERWLATARPHDIERFRGHIATGRLGISAMALNTTPLCTAEQLVRQLSPIRGLRALLGAPIRTLNQHDVNGIPWALADLMIDSGVELLTMAINIHLGRAVTPRPGVFRWQAPSGRELLVMNGNHYTMFDQLLHTWDNRVERMAEGLDEYTRVLERLEYPHDFLYLTSTNPPGLWDNSPPNAEVARLIRAWNDAGREPRIRYVTPDDLLARLRSIPTADLPLQRGDWTDYWNFGCASTAYETRINQGSKPRLFTAELLGALRQTPTHPARIDVARRAWQALNLYDEHTWGYANTVPGHPHGRAQERLKVHHAYEARELADYLLVTELDALADNPPEWRGEAGALLVNPTGTARDTYVRIPADWRVARKRLRAEQYGYTQMYERDAGDWCGPVRLPPYGWLQLPLDALQPAEPHPGIRVDGWPAPLRPVGWRGTPQQVPGDRATIESPFHRLQFDPVTGRIHSLWDVQQEWEVLDTQSPLTLFEFVRERTDGLHDDRVEAYYDRDLAKEKHDQPCWKVDWHAVRERATRPLACRVERDAISATLVLELEAPGVTGLVQRFTLRADTPLIECEVRFEKLVRAEPESIYVAVPLNLPEDWRCHFDSAGVPIELDADQLPRACRDWFTVESYVSMHAGSRGVTLYCPDAPMIQAGDFHFGRLQDSIPRPARPMMLAWPMNNYWNTNFPRIQPGLVQFRYVLETHGAFVAAHAASHGRLATTPVFVHPLAQTAAVTAGQLLTVTGDGVQLLHVKPADDARGLIVRLVNLGSQPVHARVQPGAAPVAAAWLTDALEHDRAPLAIEAGAAVVPLAPQQITTLRVLR